MERHPYVGLQATVVAFLQPGHSRYRPEYTATIVAIGTDAEECDGYAVHYPCAVLLMADGSHETTPMCRVKVDPAEAAARLSSVVMRSVIADIVHIGILVIAGLIAAKYSVDLNGYIVGMIFATFAAAVADGIKGKE